jgi:hypothetical protein
MDSSSEKRKRFDRKCEPCLLRGLRLSMILKTGAKLIIKYAVEQFMAGQLLNHNTHYNARIHRKQPTVLPNAC